MLGINNYYPKSFNNQTYYYDIAFLIVDDWPLDLSAYIIALLTFDM